MDELNENVVPKDELAEMLQDPNFNIESLGNMDGNDVEEIFKGVLTDESQESQDTMFTKSMSSYSRTSTPSHPVNTDIQQNIMRSPSVPGTGPPTMMHSPMSAGGVQAQQLQQMQTNIPMHGNMPLASVVPQMTHHHMNMPPQQQQQVPNQQQQQMLPMMGQQPQPGMMQPGSQVQQMNRGYYHTFHYRDNFYQR